MTSDSDWQQGRHADLGTNKGRALGTQTWRTTKGEHRLLHRLLHADLAYRLLHADVADHKGRALESRLMIKPHTPHGASKSRRIRRARGAGPWGDEPTLVPRYLPL